MEPLRFDGRVVIVTGAGRGIGRAHAELFAARGASVVVNDLGGAMAGGGDDEGVAATAAAEIGAAGGRALADTSDVSTPEGAQALVDAAVGEFGRLDAVVNNAGIFGVDAFPGMELEEMARYAAVHVGGSFSVTRAAWPHLVASGAGRVVMTTSTGALGHEELTAYGTAKAGVIGLARALAVIGERDGVKVNLVAPMALTRMMRTDPVPNGSEPAPEVSRGTALVSPLVALLSHESCPVTGEMYLSGMRRYSRFVLAETHGYVHADGDVTVEDIAENWDAINDPSDPTIAPSTMVWSAANQRTIAEADR